MGQQIIQVDACTDKPSSGNTAAACLPEDLKHESWMRNRARYTLYAYQASPIGGVAHVRVAADRVVLSGTAMTIMRGDRLI